jgi:conjugal transfer pilus assembly protein TraE
MKSEIFLQKTSNLFAQNRLLKFIVLVIGIAVLYNTWMIRQALNTHRTIIVPPVVNQEMEFQGERASENYLRQMIRYAVSLAVNNSPATARQQFEELLALYAPESFPDAQTALYSLAANIEEAKVTNAFYIDSIKVDEQNSTVAVKGRQLQFMQDVITKNQQTAYEIKYRIQEGRLMIISIKEVVSENS